MASIFKYLRVLLFIVIFFMIGRVYANTSYYSSKNNCEYGEQPEIADCLRNELIESTIMLKEAENNIKNAYKNGLLKKVRRWMRLSLLHFINWMSPIKHSFVIASLSARLLNHGGTEWEVLLVYFLAWLNSTDNEQSN